MTRLSEGTPADEAVRRRALDPARSFIVQAPAGSGKTELLTRRYLRLLATVDAPEEILAITFTRKAAAEMRNRVIGALELGGSDEPPADAHRRQTWALARSARAADQQRGWQLAAHPARLRIMTIDALNQSLARQLPVLSGLGAPVAIANDPGALYREAVLRVVERLGAPGVDADAIARLIAHLDNDLGLLERLLVPLLERREHWLDLGLLRLPSLTLSSFRERLEQALGLAIAEQLESVRAMVPAHLQSVLARLAAAAAVELEQSGSDSAIRACAGLQTLPPSEPGAVAAWQGLAALLLRADGEWRQPGGINRSLGFPRSDPERKRAAADLFETLRAIEGLDARLDALRALPPPRYPEQQWEVLAALLAVLRIAIGELDVVFSERGTADYAAVAIAARRALGAVDAPTDLGLRLDYRLRHVLADEFQDTSRSQVELLRLLTAGWSRGDGRTLFLVGDPMQSIYRFRDAEVGLFLRVARDGFGDIDIEPLRLTVNFRSTRPLVAWVNAAFSMMLPQRDDPGRGGVSHARSDPSPSAVDAGTVALHGLCGDRRVARTQEARRVVEIARDTWERTPQATIAILVSSRTHLSDILEQLRAAQLPCRAVEIDPLAERPVVQDLLALTRALQHLGDRTAWLAILRAPWCGLTLADLHVLCADAPSHTISELLTDAERLARLSEAGRRSVARVLPHLDAALAQRGRYGVREWVERTWNALGGPACVRDASEFEDAQVYLQRLESLESGGDLEDVGALEVVLGDLYGSTAVAAGARAIEVMTIHKAKGLEFDVVILPGLDRPQRPDDNALLRWAELPLVDGTHSLLLAAMAPRGTEGDRLHEWIGMLERDKATHERTRLLYVAATRAMRELHLLGVVESMPEPDERVRAPARGSLLALAWPFIGAELVASMERVPSTETASDRRSTDLTLQRLPASWSQPEPEPAVQRSVRTPIDDAPLRPEFDWVTETTRHIGTVVHRAIERIVRSDTALDLVRAGLRREDYGTALAELGVPPEHRARAVERVIDALESMLADERGRWLLGGRTVHRESDAELALSGFIGEELVNGVIDRTFVTTDGERWIVDFKTSGHEGGSRDAFIANEAIRYRHQLERYALLARAWEPERTVRAALYFPLLRAWVEVDV